MASAAITFEFFRADASIGTYMLVHTGLGMASIYNLGSEEQKQTILPQLAKLNADICFALTEPGHGSDASNLQTTATPVEGGYKITGTKRWIGNGTHSDYFITFARNTQTKKIQAFIVKRGSKGLRTKKIYSKWALRSTQNAQIYYDEVFVPQNMRLPKAEDFATGAAVVLKSSRVFVAWCACGIAAGAWDYMMKYIKDQTSMGKPIARHQIVQQKITRSLGNIQACILMAKRCLELYQTGKMTIGHAALCKGWTTLLGRETVRLCREVMGGNGILLANHVIKHLIDMQAIYTYEGTYDINMLVAGRQATGYAAFK